MKKILHDDYGNRAEIEEVVTLPYKGSPKKEKGYKIYKQYSGINLIKNGYNSYSTKGNTQLGKLIKQAQAVLKNCVVWYEVVNLESGTVNIIYKEV